MISPAFVSMPITDETTDALLGPYSKDDPYPALTSRNLARREQRDADRRSGRLRRAAGYRDPAPYQAGIEEAGSADASLVGSRDLMETTLGSLADDDMERIFEALGLSPLHETILRHLVGGDTLQETGQHLGLSRQAVHRHKAVIKDRLFQHWLSDPYFGLRTAMREDVCHSVYSTVFHAPAPVGGTEAECDCGRQQHRVQRGRSGLTSYFCEGCGTKRTAKEFHTLTEEHSENTSGS